MTRDGLMLQLDEVCPADVTAMAKLDSDIVTLMEKRVIEPFEPFEPFETFETFEPFSKIRKSIEIRKLAEFTKLAKLA